MENTTAKKKSLAFPIVLAILVIGGGWYGYSKYHYAQHFENTDDAQISADISPVIPRVAGYVKEVYVKDNQLVKAGDTLLLIDDRDLQIRLQEAEAALGTAESNLISATANADASKASIATAQAGISTVDAQIESAKVSLWRATQDLQRYENLYKDHSITLQQYEQAQAAKQVADKQVKILEQQKNQASKQTSAVSAQSNATTQQIESAKAIIKQRQAEVDAAKLNLSYTVITAPQSGLASKVNAQIGQFINAGQPLFSIVHSDKIWVTANFKETQLNRMIEGQEVNVEADVFPDHVFKAKVGSFSPATGSTFSLLPPDNASGNFVKVVQRLPVKIEFDEASDSLVKKLRPGMNVLVEVKVK
jgi:membrane fusion protein (multidrug efflux system)